MLWEPNFRRTVMRSICTTVAITAAGLLLFSGFAQASDVEAELRQMQERIADLESQLGSETDSFLLQEESGSFVSAMLENTDIGGFAAGSYNYNFEGFHNGSTTGNNNPSHTTSNTFQVDQVWVSIANAATEDSRGGFNVDYEWGAVGDVGTGGNLYAASVSYLAPVLGGVNTDLGLLPTLIGAEVNQTNANFNVTRGLVWGIQPVTNVGAVASMQATDSISISFGVLNDVGVGMTRDDSTRDNDNEKAITGQVAWAGEDVSASFQFNWGDGSGTSGDSETGIYDVVLNYGGMEDVSMWANYTLVSVDDGDDTHGIAVAARMALNDGCGIAVRGEALLTDPDVGDNSEEYSLTLTGDSALTDNLTAKVELRLDFSSDDTLPDRRGNADEDVAAMALAQLVYEF